MNNVTRKNLTVIVVALACAGLAGCPLNPPKPMDPDEPIAADPGLADHEVTTTVPREAAPEGPPAPTHDADGVPLDPETGQPLARVVYFDYDRSVIAPADLRVLERHADHLLESGRSIRIEGHCDERGTREYNLALGERRANAVATFLTVSGVRRSQLPQIVSYGEERPEATGSTETAWAKNRRAVLVYLP